MLAVFFFFSFSEENQVLYIFTYLNIWMFCTTGSHVGYRAGWLIDHKKIEANHVTSILKTDQAVISDKRSDEQNLSYFPKKYNKKSMYLVGHVAQAFIKSSISYACLVSFLTITLNASFTIFFCVN